MPSQLDFSRNIGGSTKGGNVSQSSGGGFIPVRVKKVNIIPSEDQQSLFVNAGKYWGIGCITFEALNKSTPVTEFPQGSIAIPLNTSVRTLPLVNEIVYVIQGPSRKRLLGGDAQSTTFYYTNSIPIWNSTDVNALPSQITSGDENTDSNSIPIIGIVMGVIIVSGLIGLAVFKRKDLSNCVSDTRQKVKLNTASKI